MNLSGDNYYKSLTILYIETNRSTAKFFYNILSKIFKEVVLVDNSKSALEYFFSEKNKIDIIISDMQLERGNRGIDVLEKIRQKDENIPFILTSGVFDTEELLEAIKLKASDFLTKPLNSNDLLSCVEKICLNFFYQEVKEEASSEMNYIMEAINEVALISKTNLKGDITYVNDYFCKISGYSKDEILGKSHELIKDSTFQIINHTNNSLGDSKVWDGKVKNISKNGDIFYTYLSVLNSYGNNKQELIWIRFLANEYEQEQEDFRKKVSQNLNNSRRINLQAREKIEELESKLFTLKYVEQNLKIELVRKEKFTNQHNYFIDEIESKEKKLETIVSIARDKLNKITVDRDKLKEKKQEVTNNLEILIEDFNFKNKTIQELKKELINQKDIISELSEQISEKEKILGIED